MTFRSPLLLLAGVAIALLGVAAPAHAQHVSFTDIRDAVPLKYFSANPDVTRADPTAPNTLEIALETGRDSGVDDAFKASTAAFGNRVAMDTLSFNVVAPAGYYVSSITYVQTGRGSIGGLAEARGGSTWVVNGQPASLGTFRTEPSLARTVTFTDPTRTIVPVSITTSLFVFAPPTSGVADLELTAARVVVTVAEVPPGPGDVKKTAVIEVAGFTGTYDGAAHGATGTATGVDGEDLSGLLVFGESFTDAPGGTANWTFEGNANYNPAAGTAAIVINRADATVSVAGFSGIYDGAAHGATGTATGVLAENLGHLLDLGASFTNVPGGTAHWTFTGGANYNVVSGDAAIAIAKATPLLSWPQPASVVAGTILSDTQLNATANVAGTFVYSPPLGTVLNATQELSVTFTPADTVNYNGAAATVTITVTPNTGVQIVNPGPQTDRVGDDVRLRLRLTGGTRADRRGVFTASGLPAGLGIREDGEIRGKPTTIGTSHVTATFTRSGVAVSTQFDWMVVPRR